MRHPLTCSVVLCALMAAMPGCVGVNRSQNAHTMSPTLGRELIDLKEAHAQGAMSDDEYNAARTRLFETRHHPVPGK